MGGAALNDIHEVRLELNRALAIEEDMWLERSKNSWLKAGDKNTNFFHTKASNRLQCNTITKVLDSNDMWIEDEEQIGHEFVRYFDGLFTSSTPRIEGEPIDAMQPKVSNRMNALLNREFQATEVEKALKQMHPMTAPGPDGMPPLFYQHY